MTIWVMIDADMAAAFVSHSPCSIAMQECNIIWSSEEAVDRMIDRSDHLQHK
jgi:hypothetical protein